MLDDLLVNFFIGFVNSAEIGHARPAGIIGRFYRQTLWLGHNGNDMKMDIGIHHHQHQVIQFVVLKSFFQAVSILPVTICNSLQNWRYSMQKNFVPVHARPEPEHPG
ncbi:MAG: hypothetical protein P0107_00060 [Nitrosomonas sp.]|nr:hypothetical protein [Nitrosomonas sp.]